MNDVDREAAEIVQARAGHDGGFFGRRMGKALRAGQRSLFETRLPRLAVPIDAPRPAELATLFTSEVRDVWLEIGFGGGEHLIATAEANPTVGLIGAEPFVNGMAKGLAALETSTVGERMRLHHADAVPLLDWLPSGSLGRVYLLYPDPWPKVRHWKRRFVSTANLDRLARVIRSGGEFRFASDWAPYVDWTLLHLLDHSAFDWTAECADDWRKPWPDWPGTRYESKALREGRKPAYLIARRRA